MTSYSETSDPIFQSYVNSFAYLIKDAEYLYEIAKSPGVITTFQCTKLCRTSVLLYIMSLEGLINRALDHFVPTKLHKFVLEHEKRFSFLDKWEMLPLLVSEDEKIQFDKSEYPWSHFAELIRMRNDFVHPTHDRTVFYREKAPKVFEQLKYEEIPDGLTYQDRRGVQKQVRERNLVYRQTRVTKDPYSLRPEDVEKVQKTVFDSVDELDRLLGGKIKNRNWHLTDDFKIIYPPGAKISDTFET